MTCIKYFILLETYTFCRAVLPAVLEQESPRKARRSCRMTRNARLACTCAFRCELGAIALNFLEKCNLFWFDGAAQVKHVLSATILCLGSEDRLCCNARRSGDAHNSRSYFHWILELMCLALSWYKVSWYKVSSCTSSVRASSLCIFEINKNQWRPRR